jgi:hypothetical protein
VASREEKLAIIGLIGGVLAVAGVFAPWATMSGSTTSDNRTVSVSSSQSGWDLANGRVAVVIEVNGGSALEIIRGEGKDYPYIALVGGILVLVGALASPAFSKGALLLAIGGMLAIAGAGWGLSDIETGTVIVATAGYGYGLYLCLAGGVLGLLGAYGFYTKGR